VEWESPTLPKEKPRAYAAIISAGRERGVK